ncbi:hypothetical protein [Kitasatospora sp. NPDC017646]|uniref:hypothetical protein n=1 Tax=Kitasatospora sp. NPDC017646 TaxID=3364024 RepID=UPI0037BA26AF
MPDLNLPGWQPADDASARVQAHFLMAEEAYDLLTEASHEELGGNDDFLLYEDLNAYHEAGRPAVAAHLHYNTDARTFTLDIERTPTFSMATAWLVERGADQDMFLHSTGHPGAPADERSAKAAERFIDANARYRLVEYAVEPGETWAMLRDTTAAGAERPYLLQVEAGDPERGYTLREGSFSSPQEVQQWLEQRRTALPPVAGADVPLVYSPQASAARTRTAVAPAMAAASEPVPAAALAAAAGRRAVR